MTAVATIIKPGLLTTVQDAGRPGARHLGVPRSGAADILSYALANAAVGNCWDAPALECTLLGPTFEFSASAGFALGGANMEAKLNDAPIPHYQLVNANRGDQLTLGRASIGARCYIAIAGGVVGQNFLGSAGTYLPASLGGIEGRALCDGDVIETQGKENTPVDIPSYLRPRLGHDWILRATPGPETKLLEPNALARFYSHGFIADKRGNRMGVRLTADPIRLEATPPMKSSPVFPGTVQCPPDGAPFLLLADAQTVGGYPRIAQVIEADLPHAGQIRPGDNVWFHRVTPEEARDLNAQKSAFLQAVVPGFQFQ